MVLDVLADSREFYRDIARRITKMHMMFLQVCMINNMITLSVKELINICRQVLNPLHLRSLAISSSGSSRVQAMVDLITKSLASSTT